MAEDPKFSYDEVHTYLTSGEYSPDITITRGV